MSFIQALAFFLASSALITLVNCAEFTNCPTEAKFGKLLKIEVTNCTEKDEKCPFQTNQNVSMELVFSPTKDFDNAKIKIAGILSKIPVPFRINPDTVCDYGAVCPLKKDEKSTIHLSFPIKQSYPKIKLLVQVILTSTTDESIVCVRFPAQIV